MLGPAAPTGTGCADDGAAAVEEAFEYLHRDHPGSVEAVTDESGNELVVLGHDPYGGRRSSGSTGGGCRGASRGTGTCTRRGSST